MQPYIYMSIGVRGDGLEEKQLEKLKEITAEDYYYADGCAEDEKLFVFETLYSPWDYEAFSASKTIDSDVVVRLANNSKSKILDYQNLLKKEGLAHLVNRVKIVIHTTEL